MYTAGKEAGVGQPRYARRERDLDVDASAQAILDVSCAKRSPGLSQKDDVVRTRLPAGQSLQGESARTPNDDDVDALTAFSAQGSAIQD